MEREYNINGRKRKKFSCKKLNFMLLNNDRHQMYCCIISCKIDNCRLFYKYIKYIINFRIKFKNEYELQTVALIS